MGCHDQVITCLCCGVKQRSDFYTLFQQIFLCVESFFNCDFLLFRCFICYIKL